MTQVVCPTLSLSKLVYTLILLACCAGDLRADRGAYGDGVGRATRPTCHARWAFSFLTRGEGYVWHGVIMRQECLRLSNRTINPARVNHAVFECSDDWKMLQALLKSMLITFTDCRGASDRTSLPMLLVQI